MKNKWHIFYTGILFLILMVGSLILHTNRISSYEKGYKEGFNKAINERIVIYADTSLLITIK